MKGFTVEMLSRRVVKRAAAYESAEAAVEEGEERSWWKVHVWVKGAGRSFPRTAWKGGRALRGLVVVEGEEDAESDSELEGRPLTCRLGADGGVLLLLLFLLLKAEEEEEEDAMLARVIWMMTERKGRPAAPF